MTAIVQTTDLSGWSRLQRKLAVLADVQSGIEDARRLGEDAINAALPALRHALEAFTDVHTAGVEPEAPTAPAQPAAATPAPSKPGRKTRVAKPTRIARCSICRADFAYLKKGIIPRRPVCGRPSCRPVAAAVRPRSDH